MKIEHVELHWVKLPLQFTFKSAKAELAYRELIVIKVIDETGISGYGEVVAFNTSFYSDEVLDDSWDKLIDEYIPLIKSVSLEHPFDIHKVITNVMPMTLAGIEMALFDLYKNLTGIEIIESVFEESVNNTIDGGIVIGNYDINLMFDEIKSFYDLGYRKFKIKIEGEEGIGKLREIRNRYPHILLVADGNRSFTELNDEHIRKLDNLQLICIEEPLNGGIGSYKSVFSKMKTPICFDESICSIEEYKRALQLSDNFMVNIKISRLGGLLYVKELIDHCRRDGIKFWIGSMIESGISKRLHIQLAGLSDVLIPGDLAHSKRYFEEDLIIPNIECCSGKLVLKKIDSINESAIGKYQMKGYQN